MSYLERLSNFCFKRNERGETVFYPWGHWGSGTVLRDESQERRLRTLRLRYYQSLILILLIGAVVGWRWVLGLFPVLILAFFLYTRKLVSSESLTDNNS